MPTDKASGLLLSMLSPVWRAKLCDNIWGGSSLQLDLEGEEASAFKKLLALGSGASVTMAGGVEELVALGRMADKYQVEVVQGAVEDNLVSSHLTVESCGIILALSFGSGLERVVRASRELALREFDKFSKTAGFMTVSEEVLGSLLDDDGLMTEKEEVVYEALLRWMKGGVGDSEEVRGEELLRKIRFPFMDGEYLATVRGRTALEGRRSEDVGLYELLDDSVFLRSIPRRNWAHANLRSLDARVLVPRARPQLRWEDCAGGGDRRLAAGRPVPSVAADGDYVCGGLDDGSIQVWSRSTLQQERTLSGHTSNVSVMLWAGGRLVSGSDDQAVMVWDVAAGRCEGVLEGHTGGTMSLAASGSRLFSGGQDRTVKVWEMDGGVPTWRCEHTLNAGWGVNSLAVWGGYVAGGLVDGSILVWDAATWAREHTLRGHAGNVMSLVVSGQRMISSSFDKTVKVWSLETWACVQSAAIYPSASPQFIRRLVLSGSTLIGGSSSSFLADAHMSATEEFELKIWDLETLQPLHTFRQPVGQRVRSLISDGGEVWGAVGQEVVVWGRRC